jgi:hypothetical protein
VIAKRIRNILNEFEKVPFPRLGKGLGDFPLYDSLIAGIAYSLVISGKIEPMTVPARDKDAQASFEKLSVKPMLTPDENEFVTYYRLLEDLRQEIIRVAKAA